MQNGACVAAQAPFYETSYVGTVFRHTATPPWLRAGCW